MTGIQAIQPSIQPVQSPNIFVPVQPINPIARRDSGFARELEQNSLFAQQTNGNFNLNYPNVKSPVLARNLDLLA